MFASVRLTMLTAAGARERISTRADRDQLLVRANTRRVENASSSVSEGL